MPSSSSGLTYNEHLLRQCFSSLSAHIYYFSSLLTPRLPHILLRPLSHHERLVPRHIASLYTLLLDRVPEEGVDEHHAAELRRLIRAEARVEDTLSGIVAWLECLARVVAGAGRQGHEMAQIVTVIRAAERWRRDAAVGFAGIRRKEERLRERVDSLCRALGI